MPQFRFASRLWSCSDIERINMYILIQLDCFLSNMHASETSPCRFVPYLFSFIAMIWSVRIKEVPNRGSSSTDAITKSPCDSCNIERALCNESRGKSCAMYNVRFWSTINFLGDFISVKFMLPNSLLTRISIVRINYPFCFFTSRVHSRMIAYSFHHGISKLCSCI